MNLKYKAKKMKQTKQKDAILSQVQHMHNHPTAEDIYNALKKSGVDVSLATVYRNLSKFAEMGKIKRVERCGVSDHFDWRLDDHQHFICERCGAICDVELDIKIDLSDTSLSVHRYDVVLYGICDKCKNKDNQN